MFTLNNGRRTAVGYDRRLSTTRTASTTTAWTAFLLRPFALGRGAALAHGLGNVVLDGLRRASKKVTLRNERCLDGGRLRRRFLLDTAPTTTPARRLFVLVCLCDGSNFRCRNHDRCRWCFAMSDRRRWFFTRRGRRRWFFTPRGRRRCNRRRDEFGGWFGIQTKFGGKLCPPVPVGLFWHGFVSSHGRSSESAVSVAVWHFPKQRALTTFDRFQRPSRRRLPRKSSRSGSS